MRTWLMRGWLAALVGMGICTSCIRADEQPVQEPPLAAEQLLVPPQVSPTAPQQMPVYPQTAMMAGPVMYVDPSYMTPALEPAKHCHCHLIHDWLSDHPCKCYADHNSVGCGSLKSECTFIFGSCRKFFGEPCLKGPQ